MYVRGPIGILNPGGLTVIPPLLLSSLNHRANGGGVGAKVSSEPPLMVPYVSLSMNRSYYANSYLHTLQMFTDKRQMN